MKHQKYPRGSLFDPIFFYTPPRAKWQREISYLFKKADRAKDDRSFILVVAMVIENRLNSLLEVVLPGYQQLSSKKELTFSLKIELGRSLRLIPDRYFDLADLFRLIRNDFAHDLKFSSLGMMKKNRKDKLRSLMESQKPLSSRRLIKAALSDLFIDCTLGIRHQQMNLEMFRYAIRSKEFNKLLHTLYPQFQSRMERTKRESTRSDAIE